jgi:hypothetical protein
VQRSEVVSTGGRNTGTFDRNNNSFFTTSHRFRLSRCGNAGVRQPSLALQFFRESLLAASRRCPDARRLRGRRGAHGGPGAQRQRPGRGGGRRPPRRVPQSGGLPPTPFCCGCESDQPAPSAPGGPGLPTACRGVTVQISRLSGAKSILPLAPEGARVAAMKSPLVLALAVMTGVRRQ